MVEAATEHQTLSERGRLRLRIALTVFLTGQFLPILIPLIRATNLSTDWKDALTALTLVGVPQALTLLTIIILGRAGFRELRSLVSARMKHYVFPEYVSRPRFYLGLLMFLAPLVIGPVFSYFEDVVPMAERLTVRFVLHITFIMSFFVLGGNFWAKFRAAFVYQSPKDPPHEHHR
jgi:hypothetical protein